MMYKFLKYFWKFRYYLAFYNEMWFYGLKQFNCTIWINPENDKDWASFYKELYQCLTISDKKLKESNMTGTIL